MAPPNPPGLVSLFGSPYSVPRCRPAVPPSPRPFPLSHWFLSHHRSRAAAPFPSPALPRPAAPAHPLCHPAAPAVAHLVVPASLVREVLPLSLPSSLSLSLSPSLPLSLSSSLPLSPSLSPSPSLPPSPSSSLSLSLVWCYVLDFHVLYVKY